MKNVCEICHPSKVYESWNIDSSSSNEVMEVNLVDQMMISHFLHRSFFFPSKLYGFRKGYSTQYALAHLLRYWQHTLDNSKIVGTVLMDLSKAYDCLPHSLLIAKLAAYGFDINSLELISSYLSNRYQRVKINSKFSNYLKVPQGVPQGSILGPLLFNFFINDLFNCIEISEVCNFADDTTIYTEGNNLEIAKTKLELETNNVLNWFKINSMVANPAKFQIMFLGQGITNKELNFKIDNITLSCSTEVKLLGIIIDEKLNFEKHISNLCSTASNRLRALTRIRPYLSIDQAKRLADSFIFSLFRYCA